MQDWRDRQGYEKAEGHEGLTHWLSRPLRTEGKHGACQESHPLATCQLAPRTMTAARILGLFFAADLIPEAVLNWQSSGVASGHLKLNRQVRPVPEFDARSPPVCLDMIPAGQPTVWLPICQFWCIHTYEYGCYCNWKGLQSPGGGFPKRL